MGNMCSGSSDKELVVWPETATGMTSFAFQEQDNWTKVDFNQSKLDACYLTYRDNKATQVEFNVPAGDDMLYFFTSELSGCSIWYKKIDDTISIIHEARTTQTHDGDGYLLIFDSNKASPDDLSKLSTDKNGKPSTPEDPESYYYQINKQYSLYALVSNDSIEFRIQHFKKTILAQEGKVGSYQLLSVDYNSIGF